MKRRRKRLPSRDGVIRLRVSKAERDALQDAADAEGVTLSQFIRRRLFRTVTTIEVLPPLSTESPR